MSQREPAGPKTYWEPKSTYSNEEVIAIDRQKRERPDIEMTEREAPHGRMDRRRSRAG